jgi:ADP-heptose:LPS heptosyltransferase
LLVDHLKIKKILIIQLGGIGDVILTTPVFSILRKKIPQAEIHFLTSSLIKNLFTEDPRINQVITYPEPPAVLIKLFKLFFKIYSCRYDLVIDYQCTPGTAQLSWVSQATYRLGWKMRRRQWGYNLFSEANISTNYVAVQKSLALEEIGITEEMEKLKVYLPHNTFEEVDRYFRKLQIDREKIMINMTPVGQVQTRQWEGEKYLALADMLVEKYQAIIFFSGKKEDQEYLELLASQSTYGIKVLPVWPLEIFTAFLSQVDLHFSYDNGPKHLAIAVDTATLSLFATDPPILWNPLNDPNHPYILADVPCNLCRLTECSLMICMKHIKPEMVLSRIEAAPAVAQKIKRQ